MLQDFYFYLNVNQVKKFAYENDISLNDFITAWTKVMNLDRFDIR